MGVMGDGGGGCKVVVVKMGRLGGYQLSINCQFR